MKRVDNMSIEERKENTRKAREACKDFITEFIYYSAKMKLKRIKNNEYIKSFDCGDADYNGFLPITNIRD